MTAIALAVDGIGVWADGIPDWASFRAIAAGARLPDPSGAPPPAPAILAPTERRRAGLAVRLALTVAQQACAMAGAAPATLRSVFASGNGDGPVIDAILSTLATDAPAVSPTQFHNSVHNAAAGYWTIATGAHAAAGSLGGADWTAASALLTAAAEVAGEAAPVLLCLYDAPMPPPLDARRPTDIAFAAALLLAPSPSPRSLARLSVTYRADAASGPVTGLVTGPGTLAGLARRNPAAGVVPLLLAIAAGGGGVVLPMLDGQVAVDVAVTGASACSTATRSFA